MQLGVRTAGPVVPLYAKSQTSLETMHPPVAMTFAFCPVILILDLWSLIPYPTAAIASSPSSSQRQKGACLPMVSRKESREDTMGEACKGGKGSVIASRVLGVAISLAEFQITNNVK